MKTATIEEIAYLIKQAKSNYQPKPIFFLGAGASKSGDIPLASEIVQDILRTYKDAPRIKGLNEKDKTYSNLMNCLQPYERDSLLKGYIDKARINVTHIYLAQLIIHDFIDYVLTVNFDNLMLRALALYNEFPSTYDMAILKDLTTSTFKEKSIVFLHGQHHGLWLLNTEEEMAKVNETVPRIFDSIKNNRPWVFIGYSGDDPIFEHIKSLGRFDNGLYWVTYNNHSPKKNVKHFLETPNTNAFLVKGFDSDSFMLKLNSDLGLEQPKVLSKPFTSMFELLKNVVDIEDDEHFKGIKERLEISKDQVLKAIKLFEEGEIANNQELRKDSKIDLLKKDIIDMIIDQEYDDKAISHFLKQAKELNDTEVSEVLAGLFYNWGTDLSKQADILENSDSDNLYKLAFSKFKKSIDLRPDDANAYGNWAVALGNYSSSKSLNEAKKILKEAIEKYKMAAKLDPTDGDTYYNWAIDLVDLAERSDKERALELYKEAFMLYEKATELNPENESAFYNWGTSLNNYGWLLGNEKTETCLNDSIAKFKKAVEINPNKYEAFNNLGITLGELADFKKDEEKFSLLHSAVEMFRNAIELDPENFEYHGNCGTAILELAICSNNKESKSLFEEAIEYFKKDIALGGHSQYRLARALAYLGNTDLAYEELENAIQVLDIPKERILNDDVWKSHLAKQKFKSIIKKNFG